MALFVLSIMATNLWGQYCVTAGPSSTFDSNTEGVTLAGDAGTTIAYTGCTAGGVSGVEDLTATQIVNVTASSSYTADVQFGTCGGNYAGAGEAWIDWNQNDQFDPSESIGTWSGLPPVALSSFSFTVPAGAINDTTRMRVTQQEGGAIPLNPCQSFVYGSVVDFTVVVSGGITLSCNTPNSLTASNITTTSADLGWTENGTATSWEIEYGPLGFAQGTGTAAVTGLNPFAVTGLSAATVYSFYVRAICGVADTSLWAGPFGFTTTFNTPTGVTCTSGGASSFIFSDDMETGIGWTGDIGLGNGQWDYPTASPGGNSTGTGPSAAQSGTTYAEYEASGNVSTIASMVSPMIDLTSATDQAELSFYMHAFGADIGTLNVGVGTTPTGPFTSVFSWTGEYQTAATDPWVHIGADLTAYLGQQIYIEFSYGGTGNGFEGDLAIDLLQVESCVNCSSPAALTTSNITASSVDLGWTQSGAAVSWEIEYGASGFSIGAGTIVASTINPYNLSGLMANSSYDFYVRTICGVGDTSAWTGPVSFTTPCNTFTLPWSEDFDNAGVLPACWSMSGGEPWLFNTAGPNHVGNAGTITGASASGGYYAVVDASGTSAPAILTSPLIDISSLTNPQLSFYEISNNEGFANSQLDVEVWDGAAWNPVATYNTNTVGWEKKEIVLTSLTFTGDAQVRFIFSEVINPGDFYDDIAIDDVTFEEAPSCITPSFLSANNVTPSDADLVWTQSGTSLSWNIEYGVAGFVQGSGTFTNTTSNPYVLTGLNANTTYGYFVQAICSVGDTSAWAGPYLFTTLCQPTVGDSLSDPIVIGSFPYVDSNSTASCYSDTRDNPSADVFYQLIVPQCTDTLTVSLCGSAYDTYIRILDASGTQIAFNDDFCAAQSEVELTGLIAGDTLYVLVEGFSANNGDYSLNINTVINCPPPANLVITEIMYNPPEAGTDSLEFVEIYNNGTLASDLTNYTLSGITYTFPAVTLPVGGYYVIGVNASAFNTVYGFAPDGIATGGLSNGGESIVIKDAFGLTIDSVRYDDNNPWPSGAAAGEPDGGGASIILCDTASNNNDGANWNASVSSTGSTINGFAVLASPGAANVCPVATTDVAIVQINVDTVFCNTPVTGSFVISNLSSVDALNQSYSILVNGFPVITDSIANLAGLSSDTIVLGPLPAPTGIHNVVVLANPLSNDSDTSNNSSTPVTIQVSNILASASVGQAIDCNGDSTGQLIASASNGLAVANYMFMWGSNASNAASDTVSALAAGIYFVTASDDIGCTAVDSIILTEPAAFSLTVDSLQNVSCNGGNDGLLNITIGGATPPYAYNWSNGATTDDLAGLTAGVYTGTVSDSLGCVVVAPVTITEPTLLIATATDLGNGQAANANGTGGTPPYTFQWGANANNQTAQTASNLTPGTYFVTVTDDNGCSSDTSVVILATNLDVLDGIGTINLFPNPANNYITVQMDLMELSDVSLSLFNSVGQLVADKQLGVLQSLTESINTRQLAAGMYTVRIQLDDQIISRKIIINKE